MAQIIYPNSQSTVKIGGYTFRHLMEGASIVIEPVNDFSSRTNAVNDGLSASKRVDADVHNVTLIVQRHSPDDKELNDWRNGDFSARDGSIKRAYQEGGVSKKITAQCKSGTILTQPTSTDNNQDADNSKTWVIQFRSVKETF